MKQKLEQIIFELRNDPMFAITVENISLAGCVVPIVRNATNETLDRDFGGAVKFFDSLFEKGMNKIRVCPKKQNGTKQIKGVGVVQYKPSTKFPNFDFEFEAKETIEVEQVKKETPNYAHAPALSGVGLSGVENFRVHHYDILLGEKMKLEAENNELKKANEKLKEETLRNELLGQKSVEKAQAQNEMLNSPIAQTLAQLLATKLMPVESTPGLGQTLSPIKQAFLKADDSDLQDLQRVAKLFLIPEADAELTELLTKYNA